MGDGLTRLCFSLLALAAVTPGQGAPRLHEGFENDFGAWSERQLGGARVRYQIIEEPDGAVLKAESDAAATALIRELDVAVDRPTTVAWRWKIDALLPGVPDERTREGDDFAARLFVIFGSGRLGPGTRALCYVWSADVPARSSFRSPYLDEVSTIVVRSGPDGVGEWFEERRDVIADFRKAFGREPERIGAVAVMVDTDNTGWRTTAWYDDIMVW